MPRFKATVEYDGAEFHGWQFQPGFRTVQGVIEEALTRRFNRQIKVHGAGRTDSGVHATGQVIHFSVPVKTEPAELFKTLNSMLPVDVAVNELEKVPVTFHARFHAVSRQYRYIVNLKPRVHERRYGWCYEGRLNAARMERALGTLLGTHDFMPFSKLKKGQKHYRCTVFETAVKRSRERIEVIIRADRFLHGMVRALVHTLVDVGRGASGESIYREIIDSGDRTMVTGLAPAEGLFLEHIRYRLNEDIKKML